MFGTLCLLFAKLRKIFKEQWNGSPFQEIEDTIMLFGEWIKSLSRPKPINTDFRPLFLEQCDNREYFLHHALELVFPECCFHRHTRTEGNHRLGNNRFSPWCGRTSTCTDFRAIFLKCLLNNLVILSGRLIWNKTHTDFFTKCWKRYHFGSFTRYNLPNAIQFQCGRMPVLSSVV